MKTIRVAVKNVLKVTDQIFRESAEQLCHKIIMRTPVDTGLLANSWVPTLNKPSRRRIKTTDKTKKKAMARATAVAQRIKPDGKMYLTNNQVYAGIIEMGRREGPPAQGSHLAPLGMARISVAEWDSIVKRVAEKYK